MPTIQHLVQYVNNYKEKTQPIYLLGLMLLFWALYDGIISFLTPIAITNHGISETLMGIIIGTASISGALFNFFLCRIFKDTNYKRLFLYMFAICLVYPLILFQANSIFIYLIAMALWGIYYDLRNIANFDYINQTSNKKEYANQFNLLMIFTAVGYLLAPLFVGALIADTFDWRPYALSWMFAVMGFFFFLLLLSVSKKQKKESEACEPTSSRTVRMEAHLWNQIGGIIFPVLLLTFFLNFFSAFFWTIGPIFAASLKELHPFNGLFMAAYTLPSLLVGWSVGSFTRRFGKKKTSFVSLIIGSSVLFFILFLSNPFLLILDIFVSSFFLSIAWPSVSGVYADYISETPTYEKEIEGLEGFFTNLGYLFGPMLAGFLAESFGKIYAFSFLGIFGVCLGVLLMMISPHKINLLKKMNVK